MTDDSDDLIAVQEEAGFVWILFVIFFVVILLVPGWILLLLRIYFSVSPSWKNQDRYLSITLPSCICHQSPPKGENLNAMR